MVTLVFFWCSTASAESTLPPCQGEDHMQWTNCFGAYLKKDLKRDGLTRDYTGEFGSSPGKREGKGTGAQYKNGNLLNTFVAEYKNDKAIRATITYPDGRKIVGEFKDGKINGKGTITYPDGRKFVGEYKDGKINGKGTQTWPDGRKFVGEYKDDKRNGKGTITYPDGRKIVGEFKDGKINGKGTETWPDGDKFVGEYKDGKINGKGTYTWPNGDKEVAVYKDGEVVKIISSTIKKESSSSSSSSSTFSSSTLSGYEHCKSVWRKLINIRNRYSKNSYNSA